MLSQRTRDGERHCQATNRRFPCFTLKLVEVWPNLPDDFWGVQEAGAVCRGRSEVCFEPSPHRNAGFSHVGLEYILSQLPLNDEQFRGAGGATLQAVARDLVKEWHPVPQRLVDEADIPA